MNPHGILPDEWILSYASGSLSEAHALIVATHCSYHKELQEKLADAEEIGSALISDLAPATLSKDMLDNLMEKLNKFDEPIPSNDNDFGLPKPLADYIGKPLDELKWRTMGPGLSQVRLWTGPNDERLWLLRAKGGAKVPSHDHNGTEMTLVLTGSYHVNETQFLPGDLELADDKTTNHQPMIDPREDCICLVVTEAPIKIHSFIGRLVQPFIGL